MTVEEAKQLLDRMKAEAEAAKAELDQIATERGFSPPPPPGGWLVPLLFQLGVLLLLLAVAYRYTTVPSKSQAKKTGSNGKTRLA